MQMHVEWLRLCDSSVGFQWQPELHSVSSEVHPELAALECMMQGDAAKLVITSSGHGFPSLGLTKKKKKENQL